MELVSIGFANIVSTWVLSRSILEELKESFVVEVHNLLFDEDGHSKLLRNDDFIR